MQQLDVGGEKYRSRARRAFTGRVLCDAQVGPSGRYQRTRSIGQYQRQMKLAASMAPAEDIERRSLKGMTWPNDGYLIGIAIEMMAVVVGSLSSGLLTISITASCSIFCVRRLTINGSSV
jgi:hypothetical protein